MVNVALCSLIGQSTCPPDDPDQSCPVFNGSGTECEALKLAGACPGMCKGVTTGCDGYVFIISRSQEALCCGTACGQFLRNVFYLMGERDNSLSNHHIDHHIPTG